jgi:hypothetical protein
LHGSSLAGGLPRNQPPDRARSSSRLGAQTRDRADRARIALPVRSGARGHRGADRRGPAGRTGGAVAGSHPERATSQGRAEDRSQHL